jgi:hypothetical protein
MNERMEGGRIEGRNVRGKKERNNRIIGGRTEL